MTMVGRRLGPYEIVSAIGAGGMGQVFRARDTRLDRDVAVKILPESFASDPDRRARFEREAKAVAALTHPNIVSLFDTGVHTETTGASVSFVVMELLDGETLRDRLTATGALSIRKAVETAIQIARGLSAAHDKQLVHRDLKPENVFLSRDGQVKILDFGLAKTNPGPEGGRETTTQMVDTTPGTVMGTVGYMAPEQVRGLAVDARTDLFALGAVLYEMLTGSRAFKRETAADTMTAILREEPPDVATQRTDASPALDRIIRHCLEKNPAERFQTARDIAFALEALSGSGTTTAAKVVATESPRRKLRPVILVMAAVALVAAGIFGGQALRPAEPVTEWNGVALGGPSFASTPRVSPDGRTLAFVAMVDRNTEVAVMTPDTGDWAIRTSKRPGGGYVTDVSWSPRGDLIYFGLNASVPMGVYSIPSVGGSPQLVLADAYAPVAVPDGSLLVARLDASHQARLYRYWPDSGRTREFPILLPRFSQGTRAFADGKTAVLVGRLASETGPAGFHLYLLDIESGATTRLATDEQERGMPSQAALAITPDQQHVLVSIAAGHLSRVVRFARDGGSEPRTLFTTTHPIGALEVGPDGSVYVDQILFSSSVWQFPVTGGRGVHLGTVESPPECCSAGATVLPDGRVLFPGVPGGRLRLLATQPGKDPRAIVTTEESTNPVAVVSGTEFAFMAGRGATRSIAIASIETGRISRRVAFDKGVVESLAASKDGQTLFVGAAGTIWAQPIAGGAPRAIRKGTSAITTPDGKRLIVHVLETPKVRLFEVPIDGGPEREIQLHGSYGLTFDALSSGAISRDDRLLVPLASPNDWYFLPGVVDLKTGQITAIPVDEFADFHFVLWGLGEKSIIAGGYPTRDALWRFQSDVR